MAALGRWCCCPPDGPHVYLRVGTQPGAAGATFACSLFRLAGIALVLALLLQPSRQEFLPPPNKDRVTLVARGHLAEHEAKRRGEMPRALMPRKISSLDSGVVARNGCRKIRMCDCCEFNDDAQPLQEIVLDLAPRGKDPRASINPSPRCLNTPAAGEAVNALILLTDGHDFELVNPAKTGAAARDAADARSMPWRSASRARCATFPRASRVFSRIVT